MSTLEDYYDQYMDQAYSAEIELYNDELWYELSQDAGVIEEVALLQRYGEEFLEGYDAEGFTDGEAGYAAGGSRGREIVRHVF